MTATSNLWAMRSAVLALVMLATLVPTAPASAADPCASGGPPAFFLGVVYDPEQRDDFVLDIDNFEHFLARFRGTYCIPSNAAKILAMEDGFVRNGKTYAEGSERLVKQELSRLGAAASAADDATFFFFLSSHGLPAARYSCPGGARLAGSFSGLKADGREDGSFLDCELGAALNDKFDDDVRMGIYVDCSFCGGFSDSVTAVSGTIPDGSVPVPSGILGPNRVVVTGCAITTECFGGPDGGRLYGYMRGALKPELCDGYTAPGFPGIQGIDLPVRDGPQDGICSASELHFAAVERAYLARDAIAIQEQFRIKYGPASLDDDIPLV